MYVNNSGVDVSKQSIQSDLADTFASFLGHTRVPLVTVKVPTLTLSLTWLLKVLGRVNNDDLCLSPQSGIILY